MGYDLIVIWFYYKIQKKWVDNKGMFLIQC